MPSAFALRLDETEYTEPRPLAAWEPSDAMLFRLPHYGSHKHRDHLLTALDAIAPIDHSTDGDDLLVVTPALLPDGYEEFLEVVACCDNGVRCDRAQFAKALGIVRTWSPKRPVTVTSRGGLTLTNGVVTVTLPEGCGRGEYGRGNPAPTSAPTLPAFACSLPGAQLKELVAAVTEPTLGLLPLGRTLVVGDGIAVETLESIAPLPDDGATWTQRISFDLLEFIQAIEPVAVAASKDETRARLTGIHIVVESERATFVATDTHRCAVRHLAGRWPVEAPVDVIVPKDAVTALLRAARKLYTKKELAQQRPVLDVSIGALETLPGCHPILRFDLDAGLALTVCTALIYGDFPDYRRVLPCSHAVALEFDRADLLAAVRLVAIVSREDNRKLYFRLGPERFQLSACSTKIGRASHYWDRHEYDVAWQVPAEPLELVFNADYVMDALGKLPTERVRLELTAPNQPGVIRGVGGEDFAYVLMPMHLV